MCNVPSKRDEADGTDRDSAIEIDVEAALLELARLLARQSAREQIWLGESVNAVPSTRNSPILR